jgi:hypothetical protein
MVTILPTKHLRERGAPPHVYYRSSITQKNNISTGKRKKFHRFHIFFFVKPACRRPVSGGTGKEGMFHAAA